MTIDAIAREGLELAGKATKGPMVVEYGKYNLWPKRIRTDSPHYEQSNCNPRNTICVAESNALANVQCGEPMLTTHKEESANFELFAHAGTHYAALCRAVVEMHEALQTIGSGMGGDMLGTTSLGREDMQAIARDLLTKLASQPAAEG